MRCLLSLSLAGLLACWTTSASAQQLIVNGGFETGDFTGWTITGVGGDNFIDTNPADAHSGNFSLETGPVGGLGFFTQTAATTAGSNYVLSFWLRNLGGPTNEFQVSWEGNVLLDTMNTAADPAYVNYTFNVTATTNGSSVSFGFRQDPSFWLFDDASLVAAAVPEPATWALMAGAVIVSAGYVTWKRRAKLRMIEQRL
jgi:hypothetical protein